MACLKRVKKLLTVGTALKYFVDSQKITHREVNSPVSLLGNKKNYASPRNYRCFLWCLFIDINRKSGSKPCRLV